MTTFDPPAARGVGLRAPTLLPSWPLATGHMSNTAISGVSENVVQCWLISLLAPLASRVKRGLLEATKRVHAGGRAGALQNLAE